MYEIYIIIFECFFLCMTGVVNRRTGLIIDISLCLTQCSILRDIGDIIFTILRLMKAIIPFFVMLADYAYGGS